MLRGKVFKFGDNISTDLIIPGRLLHLRSNLPELAKHVLEDVNPTFVERVKSGDFVVGGKNFGLGSSREHAPIIIKMAGVGAVLAKSFARIFFRNSINIGLPILECDEAVEQTESGDILEVELASGEIKNTTKDKVFQAKPYPDFMLELIAAGGLIEHTKKRLQE